MTVAAVFAKLQSLASASSGIVSASTQVLTLLNDVSLPAVVSIPGPAEWNEHANGLYRQIRTWYIRCLVMPESEGRGVDEAFQKALPIMQALGTTYIQNQTLDNTVDEIRQPFACSGIKILEYAGVRYHGFELTMRITEKAT